MITSSTSTWPSGDLVWNVCRAIALAEGAGVPGSAPDRYNNPGDLSKGDEHGQAVSSYTTLQDGENLIVFASKEAGWNALYTKIANIVSGASSTYAPSMSWRQIAQKYAGNASAWLSNVTTALGVAPDDTFASYFQAGAPATQSSDGGAQPPPAAFP